MLRANDDKDAFLRYAGVWALAQLDDTATLANAATDSAPAVRMAALLTYRRLASPEVAKFLDDADPRIVLEAARAIHDTYIESARPALAAMIAHTGLNEHVIARVLNSAYRLGTPDAARACHFRGQRYAARGLAHRGAAAAGRVGNAVESRSDHESVSPA